MASVTRIGVGCKGPSGKVLNHTVSGNPMLGERAFYKLSNGPSYGGALLVLDFGTATTFDVVDTEGNYRGGRIHGQYHRR